MEIKFVFRKITVLVYHLTYYLTLPATQVLGRRPVQSPRIVYVCFHRNSLMRFHLHMLPTVAHLMPNQRPLNKYMLVNNMDRKPPVKIRKQAVS